MITPIILCGGSGTRLWPLSRNAHPKQLLPLIGKNSLLQDTVLRAITLPDVAVPLVICNEEHRFLVAEQLQEAVVDLHPIEIMLEPIGKNTAPAIAVAALHCIQKGEDPLLLVLPADHVIKNSEQFLLTIAAAKAAALQGSLVTFGIVPTKPETGYGYIKKGEKLNAIAGYHVAQFVEKPNAITAQSYLASGDYFWNSGMFMFRASCFLAELEKYAPDILAACQKSVAGMVKDIDFCRLNREAFSACRSDSIDYAVMEKSKDVVVVPLDSEWSDIGSWNALWEIKQADQDGNVIQGENVYLDQVKNSYIHAEGRMIAAIGIDNHIIIETADAVLVANKNNGQDVKTMVDLLRRSKRPEVELHCKVSRPWGNYESLNKTSSSQIKRIVVKQGAQLSLQMHHHRSEHWIVLKGIATVTRGEETFELYENQSTYIPLGVKHRLANFGTEPLEIIEVQTGSYLGEDDIVRFEDVYGREKAN